MDPAIRRLTIVLSLVVVGAVACDAIVPHTDVALYQHYGHAMLRGPLAAGLPREYPALAGGIFAVLASLPLPFLVAFELLMAAVLIGLIAIGVRVLRDSAWGERTLLYLILGVGSLMFARYDLLPATCCFFAVLCARRDRFAWAWVLAGAGAALKVFPALLLPAFFLYECRKTGRPPWRKVMGLAATVLALASIQAVVAPGTLLEPVRYELARGFEIYSVPGSLSLLLNPFHLHWHLAFGGWQVTAPGGAAIAHFMAVLEVVAGIVIWTAIYRARLTLEAGSLAILSLALLTDRAFTPQYLIWLAPLWALWPVRRGWLATALLTFLSYPVSLGVASEFRLGLMMSTVLGLARNVVFIAAMANWLREELRSSATAPPLRDRMGLPLTSGSTRESLRTLMVRPTPALIRNSAGPSNRRKADF